MTNIVEWKLILFLTFHHQSQSGKILVLELLVKKLLANQIVQDSWKCNISRKKWMMKFVFGMQINIEVFYKLILSLWVCIVRHAQSTQNKFE